MFGKRQILKHCQRLYVLQHGVSTGFVDYEDVTGQPAYRQCVADYAERKRAARHDVHLSYLANPNSALNISTEDLVADDPEAGQQSCEPTKGVLKLQNFMLGGMLSLDAIFAAICPLLVVVYVSTITSGESIIRAFRTVQTTDRSVLAV